MSNKGYIRLNRKFFENALWKEPREYSRAEAWLDLIQSARFESSTIMLKGRVIEVQKGEIAASRRYLENRWSWGSTKVNNFLEMLKANQMATTKQTSGQTIISLCNYSLYNEVQTSGQTADKPPTNQWQTSGKPKIKNLKELKELKNEKEEESVGGIDGDGVALPSPLGEVEVVDGEIDVATESTNPDPAKSPVKEPTATTPHCGAPPPKLQIERAKAVVDYFNAHCITLPKVQQLTEPRKAAIKARLGDVDGAKTLQVVIDKTAASNFLNGRNGRGWKANFDWILKPTNYTKILEGTYDNDNTCNNQLATTKPIASGANGYRSTEADKRASRAELENLATAILSGTTSP